MPLRKGLCQPNLGPFKDDQRIIDDCDETYHAPDIAATIAAFARAAVNAVWYQKWGVHLRYCPEAGGGIVHLLNANKLPATDKAKLGNFDIALSSAALNLSNVLYGSDLLSQAFSEGSPTYSAYPVGHGIQGGIHWRGDTDAWIRLVEAVAIA